MTMRIVVIGGVAAGMSAASQAKRRDRNAEVIVLERGPHISYSACGMPYNVGMPSRALDDLVLVDAKTARSERGVDVRTGHEVLSIDPGAGLLHVRSPEGADEPLSWDRLVLATGASAARPSLPGLDLPGVFVLRELTDAAAIKEHLAMRPVRSAVVIGAGYIGLEMADALRGLGIEVTVLEKMDRVLPGWAEPICAEAKEELVRAGVRVETGVSIERVERDGEGLHVSTDRGRFEAALVLVSVGVRPNTALARDAGIALGASGAIATDDQMRTNVPSVFAAGDCAEAWHLVTGRPIWIPLGTTANKQGKVAGANAAGAKERFAGIVGTAGFKLFEHEVARTGIDAAEAAQMGLDAVIAVSHHHTRGRNYPGDGPVLTVVTVERRTGRLLGAQMIGGGPVAKRIDVFATALTARMTVAQVEGLDLSYAPPFAPVYDPILIAATVARKAADHPG
jgi:NADPH-dependent 2,4-dienoyl-CoA reductase/sulfur reductase-like enzyme